MQGHCTHCYCKDFPMKMRYIWMRVKKSVSYRRLYVCLLQNIGFGQLENDLLICTRSRGVTWKMVWSNDGLYITKQTRVFFSSVRVCILRSIVPNPSRSLWMLLISRMSPTLTRCFVLWQQDAWCKRFTSVRECLRKKSSCIMAWQLQSTRILPHQSDGSW